MTPQGFPNLPRTPLPVRVCAAAVALLGLGLAICVTTTSLRWVGTVFPGFFLVDNRMVGVIRLAAWPGSSVPGLVLSEVVAVDDARVHSAHEVYTRVARTSPHTPVRYRLRRRGLEREVVVPSVRFTRSDWLWVFGPALLNGVVFLAAGLTVWVLRPGDMRTRAFLAATGTAGVFSLALVDHYGPARFERLYLTAEALLPAAVLQGVFMLGDLRHARLRLVGYPLSAVLAVFRHVYANAPTAYATLLLVNELYLALITLGGVAVFGVPSLIPQRLRRGPIAEQGARLLRIGAVLGGGPAAVLIASSIATSGRIPMNAAVLCPLIFVLFGAYAIVKQDVFQLGAIAMRSAYYFVMTGAVTVAYLAAVGVSNFVLRGGAAGSPIFPLLFVFAVLVGFGPLRRGAHWLVDRAFFGVRYDGPRVLAKVAGSLVTALTRDRIARILDGTVAEVLPNSATRIFLEGRGGELRDAGTEEPLPSVLRTALRNERVITPADPPALYTDGAGHAATAAELAALRAEIAVPIRVRGELAGVLTLGRKRSGRYYTAADADFLRALGQQAAIALENARSYEALVELTAGLEARVRQRTKQLEDANRQLDAAYTALKQAELQLVQAEKMTSLGQLVAGVAHEINNPVSFIVGNVEPLRELLERLAALGVDRHDAELTGLVMRLRRTFDVVARGAERTAGIVRDLRTFSRLGDSRPRPVDLHESIDASLRLLRPRWAGRITIHRDYGPLSRLEAAPAQINEVLMNVLANACDAIPGTGNIGIRTGLGESTVFVAVRDDGTGIAPEHLPRVFEPFFTTKPQGKGTGLGLAIAHGVVAGHGGRIEVTSARGQGSEFTIILPRGSVGAGGSSAPSSMLQRGAQRDA